MERIRRSWALAKASLEVLKHDKELMVFPIISAIGVMLVSIGFLVPSLVGNLFDNFLQFNLPIFAYVVLFMFYLVEYTVIFFCNTALVGAAMIRLRGGDPTVKDGFQIAFSRFVPIIGWALVSATVGVLLNTISSRSRNKGRGIGSIISSVLGAAWNVVTFLVVPVLAMEGLGPIKAVQRSWELLKRSWGEQIAGTISIGAVVTLIGVVGGLLLVGAGVGLSMLLESFIPAIIFGVLCFFFIVALSLVNATLTGIYTAAVYAYATDGQVGLFDEKLIRGAVNV